MNTIIRAFLMGFKSVLLFYFTFFATAFSLALVIAPLDGFLSAAFVFIKNRKAHKIIVSVLGLAVTGVLFFWSLIMGLPDWLANYLEFGDGGAGGGLDAGGWFAFNFSILSFFAVSVFLGFPLGLAVLHHIRTQREK